MTHHGEGLFRLTNDRALVDAIKKDFRSAGLGERHVTMLEYADTLTREPCTCTEDHVKRLRAAGFTDADIHDIVQTTAYYAFVNRMACGLGVELESYWEENAGK